MRLTRNLRRLAALLGYVVIAVWLTWPLASRMTTHLPEPQLGCRWDTLQAAWALATTVQALGDDPTRLLEANIYHPTPHARGYGVTALGALPLFSPVYLLTGNPALAINVTFLAGIVLTAWAVHLVVASWTGRELAALVAGATILATRWTLWDWVPVAPSYAVLWWLPAIIWLVAGGIDRSRGGALLLAAVIALQCLADQVYVAPAVLIPLAALALWRLSWRATRSAGWRLCGALLVAVLLIAPAYAPYALVRAANPDLARQSLWRQTFETLPGPLGGFLREGLFLPPVSPLAWYLAGMAPSAVPLATLLAIAAGGARWRRRREGAPPELRRAWAQAALWTVSGLVMALPPAVRLGGLDVVLPHLTTPIIGAPLLTVFRQPMRFGVPALVGAALLAGLGTAELLSRRPARSLGLVAILIAAMYAEHRWGLGGLTPSRPPRPARYPLAAAIDGDGPIDRLLRQSSGPVLELPIGTEGTDPTAHARAMYRSIFHHRPILNGYGSYWPEAFPRRMALARQLPDPAALRQLWRETGVAAILVHLSSATSDLLRWRALTPAGGEGLRVVAEAGDDVLFAVTLADEG